MNISVSDNRLTYYDPLDLNNKFTIIIDKSNPQGARLEVETETYRKNAKGIIKRIFEKKLQYLDGHNGLFDYYSDAYLLLNSSDRTKVFTLFSDEEKSLDNYEELRKTCFPEDINNAPEFKVVRIQNRAKNHSVLVLVPKDPDRAPFVFDYSNIVGAHGYYATFEGLGELGKKLYVVTPCIQNDGTCGFFSIATGLTATEKTYYQMYCDLGLFNRPYMGIDMFTPQVIERMSSEFMDKMSVAELTLNNDGEMYDEVGMRHVYLSDTPQSIPVYVESYNGDNTNIICESFSRFMPNRRLNFGPSSSVKTRVNRTKFLSEWGETIYLRHLRFAKARDRVMAKYNIDAPELKGINRKVNVLPVGARSFEV